jgi:hypothetical protein
MGSDNSDLCAVFWGVPVEALAESALYLDLRTILQAGWNLAPHIATCRHIDGIRGAARNHGRFRVIVARGKGRGNVGGDRESVEHGKRVARRAGHSGLVARVLAVT